MKTIRQVGIATFLVSALLAVGTAEAASPAVKKVCVSKTTGMMRYLLPTGKQTCELGEVRLIWNKKGVAGPTGATGAITYFSHAPGGDIVLRACCSSPNAVATITATTTGTYFYVARAEIKDGNSAGMGYCQVSPGSIEIGQNTEIHVYTGIVSLTAGDTLTLYCQGNSGVEKARNPSIVAIKVG